MRCTHCQAENTAGAKFCRACGNPMPVPAVPAPSLPATVACPRCQAENAPGARFCKACGASMTVAPPMPLDADATMLHSPAQGLPIPSVSEPLPPSEAAVTQPIPQPAPQPAPQPVLRPASVKPTGGAQPRFGSISEDEQVMVTMKPSRAGLLIGLSVAALAVLAGAGGAVWYFMRAQTPVTPAIETPREQPRELPPLPPSVSEPQPTVPPAPTQAAPAAPEPAAPPAPAAVLPEPAKPATGVPPAAPVSEKEKPKSKREAPPRREAPATVVQPPPPQPTAPVTPRLPAWLEGLRSDMTHCVKKDWLTRQICTEKARNKYCPGHWDEVKECEQRTPQHTPG